LGVSKTIDRTAEKEAMENFEKKRGGQNPGKKIPG